MKPRVSSAEGRARGLEPLRWIAAYKLLKAVVSLVAGLLVLRLMHRDLPAVALHWMAKLHVEPHSTVGRFILHRVVTIKDRRLGLVAGLLIAYVPLAVAEGWGLMLRRLWAEWITVVTTCVMIPLEMFEVYKRTTAPRVLILVLNIAVLIYLIVRIKRDRHPELGAELHRATPPQEQGAEHAQGQQR